MMVMLYFTIVEIVRGREKTTANWDEEIRMRGQSAAAMMPKRGSFEFSALRYMMQQQEG